MIPTSASTNRQSRWVSPRLFMTPPHTAQQVSSPYLATDSGCGGNKATRRRRLRSPSMHLSSLRERRGDRQLPQVGKPRSGGDGSEHVLGVSVCTR